MRNLGLSTSFKSIALVASFSFCLVTTGCEEGGEDAAVDLAAEPTAEGATADDAEKPEAKDAAAAEGEAGEAGEKAHDAAATLPARRFLEVTGSVTIDGEPAAVNTEIGATATIKTGADGHALFTLMPDSIIEIRKKSELKFGKSERHENSLSLLTGALWSFLPKGMADYEVVTPNAVAGVRGTVFYVEANSGKKSYICACDGHIDITQAKGKYKKPLKSVTSKDEHKAFYVTSKGKKGKLKAKKSKRLNHTDAEKDAIMAAMPSDHHAEAAPEDAAKEGDEAAPHDEEKEAAPEE